MKDSSVFTKYHLLVLEEIKNSPFFFKRNNLIKYDIHKDEVDDKTFIGKVNAVWDLRDYGAFRIEDSFREKLNYEFSLEIYHIEFGQIYHQVKSNIYRIFSVKPSDWGWSDKNKGEYQFGKIIFKQRGDTRKPVFAALMDTFERSPLAISIETLHEITKIKKERIRIEIDAINTRLSDQVGIFFKGSGQGFYTLEQVSASFTSSK